MAMIRVALAEDHVLLHEGISRLISANEDFELAGAASDLPELPAVVAEGRRASSARPADVLRVE
jgi:DNA-binding NarL/FixJ family response regulator